MGWKSPPFCAQCTGTCLKKNESLETKVKSLQIYSHCIRKSGSVKRSHMRLWRQYDCGITISYLVWRQPWNMWVCKNWEEFNLIIPVLSRILQIFGLYLPSTPLKLNGNITPVPPISKVSARDKARHTMNLHRITVFAPIFPAPPLRIHFAPPSCLFLDCELFGANFFLFLKTSLQR